MQFVDIMCIYFYVYMLELENKEPDWDEVKVCSLDTKTLWAAYISVPLLGRNASCLGANTVHT